MSPNDFLEVLLTKPFAPFRIHLTGGTAFDVRHPDQCGNGRTVVRVMVRDPGTAGSSKDMVCSLRHVIYLEPLAYSN